MMRFRLSTLMIVVTLGPPVRAAAWWAYQKYQQRWDVATISGFTLQGVDGKPVRLKSN